MEILEIPPEKDPFRNDPSSGPDRRTKDTTPSKFIALSEFSVVL